MPAVQIDVAGRTFDAAALAALGVATQEVETPKGEKRSYTGVRLPDLLKAAGVSGETITLVGKDGYEAEVKLADLTPEPLLAFGEAGLVAILPGLAGGAWVRDLAETRLRRRRLPLC